METVNIIYICPGTNFKNSNIALQLLLQRLLQLRILSTAIWILTASGLHFTLYHSDFSFHHFNVSCVYLFIEIDRIKFVSAWILDLHDRCNSKASVKMTEKKKWQKKRNFHTCLLFVISSKCSIKKITEKQLKGYGLLDTKKNFFFTILYFNNATLSSK